VVPAVVWPSELGAPPHPRGTLAMNVVRSACTSGTQQPHFTGPTPCPFVHNHHRPGTADARTAARRAPERCTRVDGAMESISRISSLLETGRARFPLLLPASFCCVLSFFSLP
jgi:hypothetical protein